MGIEFRNIFFVRDIKNDSKMDKGRMDKQRNENRPDKDEKFQWQKISKNLLFWLLIIIVTIWISQRVTQVGKNEVEIKYKQFKVYLEQGIVSKVDVQGNELHGELNEPQENPTNFRTNFTSFYVILPEDLNISTTEKWIEEYGLDPSFKQKKMDWWSLLLNSLPFVLIIFFWFFLLKRMQGGGQKGIFSFGKSKAKLLAENKIKVTFDDVAGADEAKQELKEIIEFLKEPENTNTTHQKTIYTL